MFSINKFVDNFSSPINGNFVQKLQISIYFAFRMNGKDLRAIFEWNFGQESVVSHDFYATPEQESQIVSIFCCIARSQYQSRSRSPRLANKAKSRRCCVLEFCGRATAPSPSAPLIYCILSVVFFGWTAKLSPAKPLVPPKPSVETLRLLPSPSRSSLRLSNAKRWKDKPLRADTTSHTIYLHI